MTEVLVPRDLLRELDGGTARHKRLLVTGWILGYALRDPLPALRRAHSLWPADKLNRSKPVTVLSVLLELEELGICHGTSVHDERFFCVDVLSGKETAA